MALHPPPLDAHRIFPRFAGADSQRSPSVCPCAGIGNTAQAQSKRLTEEDESFMAKDLRLNNNNKN